MTPSLELRLHRAGWCVAAAVLALASCRGGQAMGNHVPDATKMVGFGTDFGISLAFVPKQARLPMLADDGTPIPPTPTAVATPTVPAIVYAQGESDEATPVSGEHELAAVPSPGHAPATVAVSTVRPAADQSTPSPAAVGQLTRVQLDAILAQAGWPQSLWAWAENTTWRESNWKPGVWNSEGSGAVGLFQLLGWASWCGVSQLALTDALTNARCAWLVYQAEGASPWGG